MWWHRALSKEKGCRGDGDYSSSSSSMGSNDCLHHFNHFLSPFSFLNQATWFRTSNSTGIFSKCRTYIYLAALHVLLNRTRSNGSRFLKILSITSSFSVISVKFLRRVVSNCTIRWLGVKLAILMQLTTKRFFQYIGNCPFRQFQQIRKKRSVYFSSTLLVVNSNKYFIRIGIEKSVA